MPLEKYYGGHGKKVMSSMKEKKNESIFYATAKKRGVEPSNKFKKLHGVK